MVEEPGQRTERIVVAADAQQLVESVDHRHQDSEPGQRGDRVVGQANLQILQFRRQRFVQPRQRPPLRVDVEQQPPGSPVQIIVRVAADQFLQHARLARPRVRGDHDDTCRHAVLLLEEIRQQPDGGSLPRVAVGDGTFRAGFHEQSRRHRLQDHPCDALEIRHVRSRDERSVGKGAAFFRRHRNARVARHGEHRLALHALHGPGGAERTSRRPPDVDQGTRVAERGQIALDPTLPVVREPACVRHGFPTRSGGCGAPDSPVADRSIPRGNAGNAPRSSRFHSRRARPAAREPGRRRR